MLRLHWNGCAKLGSYSAPRAFARAANETTEQHLARCGRAYLEAAAAALDDYGAISQLKSEIKRHGAAAFADFQYCVVAPAIVPFNCKINDAATFNVETLAGHPVVLLFAPPCGPFATFPVATTRPAARLQQVLRAAGTSEFIVVVAPSGPAFGTMDSLLRLVPCQFCRTHHAVELAAAGPDDAEFGQVLHNLVLECSGCRNRRDRLEAFLDLPAELYRCSDAFHHPEAAARDLADLFACPNNQGMEEVDPMDEGSDDSACSVQDEQKNDDGRLVRLITFFGLPGEAFAARARLLDGVHVDGAPDGVELETGGPKPARATLKSWAEWADRLRDHVRPAAARPARRVNTTLNLYRILRLRRLFPELTDWDDEQLAEGAGPNVDIAKERRLLRNLELFCETIARTREEMLAFVRRVLGVEGECDSVLMAPLQRLHLQQSSTFTTLQLCF